MKPKSTKRKLLSLLLTLVMVLGMLPTVAFAANTSDLRINDVQMYKSDAADTYWVDGAFALSGSLGDGHCTAHFNRDTATLTLNGYNGSGIAALTSNVCDFTVKLVGDNVITTGNFGIQSADGDITITSDSGGTLTINATQADYACGIVSGYSSGSTNSKVKISGNAAVTINVNSDNSTRESYAIHAVDGIFISDSASLTATVLTTANQYGYGLYQSSNSGSGIVINTTGNITIDNTNVGQWTHTIRSDSNITLTNVGTMTLDYQMYNGTYGGAFNREPTYNPSELYRTDTPDMTSGRTVITPVAPAALTGTATITGTAKYGETLSASLDGSNNTGTLSYQWKRSGSDISGATNSTYALVEADIGSTITVDITSSVQTGTRTSSATATVEKADGPVAPAGLVGVKPTTLGGSDGKITGTTTAMEHSTDSNFASPAGTVCSGDEITGLTAGTYYVRVAGTSTTKAGANATVTVPEFGSTALTGTATITGTAKYGETLSASLDGSNNTGTLSYQWKRGGTNIGTNSNTYALVEADIGSTITVDITSSVQTGTRTSSATATVEKADGPVAPTGLTGVKPTTLGGSDGKITGTTAAMEYSTDSNFASPTGTVCSGDEITGLTAGTYYVRVAGTSTTKAGAYVTVTVPAGDPAALTGTATISGTAKFGQTLTASLESGNNTGTLSYQWKRGGTNIGTNSNTYALVEADIGSTITVDITSSVQTGTRTSSATATVEKADGPVAPTGLVGVKPTTLSGSDGKITGTTAAMEYSTDSAFTSPIACAGTETTGLTAGTYYVRMAGTSTTKAGAYATVTIPAGDAPLTYMATVTPNGKTFAARTVGYGEQTAETFTITNTGTGALASLDVALTGTNAGSFTLDKGSLNTNLAASGATTFTVKPNTGLAAGTYTATVRVTATNLTTIDKTVSFTVNPSGGGGGGGGSYTPPSANDKAVTAIKNAKDGDTVEMTLPEGKSTVDKKVFDALQGKDVTLKITSGNVVWAVSGKDIPEGADLASLDLGVTTNASVIPAAVIDALTGEKTTMQLSIKHNGPFGFPMTMEVKLDAKNAGLFANLYKYLPDSKTMSYRGSAKIGADGKALLGFTGASDYAVVIDNASHENPFKDVSEGKYYYDAVLWAASNEITGGNGPETFGPDASCTRAQAVTFLWRAAGKPVVNYAMPFTDVPADAYYTEAVRWALSEGITGGTGATTFSPNDTCTRAQIVSFIYRANKIDTLNIKDNPFTDVVEGSYYYDAVLWAKENGVTGGTSATTFSPNDNCTRGQIVSFLYRYFVK